MNEVSMNLETLMEIKTGRQLPAMLHVARLSTHVYRASFVAAASACGLLALLRQGDIPFDRIAEHLDVDANACEALDAWLGLGVRIGELSVSGGRYTLAGALSRRLAEEAADTAASMLEEVVRYHQTAVFGLPELLAQGRRLELADQDGALIARSTRVVEPLVREAVRRELKRAPVSRILEIGCGSAAYMRYAATLDHEVIIDGLELQADVAHIAQRNIEEWGLAERCAVRTEDIRACRAEAIYDLVTRQNNIYYFPVEDRLGLLEQVLAFLRPGGRLLLTSACQGGSPGLAALNLWFAASSFGGRLPSKGELEEQMKLAGLGDVSSTSLLPMDSFYSFRGVRQREA
jgi:4-hydroxy-2,2'-bipyrrole-5-carbaldehyde O-methyltransferase